VFRMPDVDALLRKVSEQCRRNLENVSEEDSETEAEYGDSFETHR